MFDAASSAPTSQLLPTDSRLGPVHLGVTDMARALAVWTGVLGLGLVREDADEVALGADGRKLVVLQADASAQVAARHTGLYHLAIHFKSRREFARTIARLFARQYPNSPTDHTVTETTYLWDPDGNGIELTHETPERGEFIMLDGIPQARTADGKLRSMTEPLDLDSVLSELTGKDDLDPPISGGIRIGHVHLHVKDLDESFAFYRDLIGFRPQMNSARFQIADLGLEPVSIPHALALNTWAGSEAPPPPPGAAGLRHFTIATPSGSVVSQVADRLNGHGWPFEALPDGIRLLDPSRNRLQVQTLS